MPKHLVGVVEEVGVKGKKAFNNYDELWEILNARGKRAKHERAKKIKNGGKEMRREKAGRVLISLLGVLLLFSIIPLTGYAVVPETINYQGYLTDSGGLPVDDTVQMTFSIYDTADPVVTTPLWTETHSSITVNNGVYSVVLGSVDPAGNPLNLPFDTQYYLGVEVGTDGEMTPRQPLTSVPYAMNADTAEYAIDVADEVVTTAKIAAGAVTSDRISDGSVASADVGFNYADSSSKGGPALDLACTGCVSSGELDFTAGDGHSLDAADGSPADAVYVSNGGLVGIGTTTPGANLSVGHLTGVSNWGIQIGSQDTVGLSLIIGKDINNYAALGWVDNEYAVLGTGSGQPLALQRLGGNVGIGTETPEDRLDVRGRIRVKSTSDGKINLDDNGGGADTFTIGTHGIRNDFYIHNKTDNKYLLNITEAGNVGIGTGMTAPAGKLDVNGDICLGGVCRTSWPTGSGTGAFTDTGTLAYYTGGNVGIGTTSPNNELEIGSASIGLLSGNAVAVSNDNDESIVGIGQSTTARGRMRWAYNATEADSYMAVGDALGTHPLVLQDYGGNVGIGTASPSEKLTVAGTIESTSGGIKFPDGTTQTTASSGGGLWTQSSSSIYYNSGNVGIGTTSPGGKLDINGDICLGGVCRTTWPTGSGSGAFTDTGTLAYYTGGNVGIGTSTPAARLDVNGDFNVTPGTYYYTNDEILSGHSLPRCSCDVSDISFDCPDSFYTDIYEDTSCYDWRTRIIYGNDRMKYVNQIDHPPSLMIAASGNVGIGTANPQAKLDVINSDSGDNVKAVYGEASETEADRNYGGYFVAKSGWGIGVYGSSESTAMVFGDNSYGGYFEAAGGWGRGVLGIHVSSGNYGMLGSNVHGVYGYSDSGTGGYFSTNSGYGLIVEQGNVGIGTTAPAAKLDVAGGDDSFAWGGDHSDSDYIRIGNLQICWGSAVLTGSSHQRSFNFTFPAPFNETPKVTNGLNADSSGYAYAVFDHSVSSTGYSGSMVEIDFRSSSTNVTMNYMAIGTWQ
jgi:hypothetical protein